MTMHMPENITPQFKKVKLMETTFHLFQVAEINAPRKQRDVINKNSTR